MDTLLPVYNEVSPYNLVEGYATRYTSLTMPLECTQTKQGNPLEEVPTMQQMSHREFLLEH